MRKPKTIVVGTDFSKLSEIAHETAFALARRLGVGRVHLVHILDQSTAHAPYPFAYATTDYAELERRRNKILSDRLESIVAEGVNVTREIRPGIPSRDLAAAAKEVEADLVVVASHGYGAIRRSILGSVASSLIRTAEAPVLIVGEKRHNSEFRNVVAGVDTSDLARDVLEHAIAYTDPDGRVEVVSAFEQPLVVSDEVLPRLPTADEGEKARVKRVEEIEAMIPEDTTATVHVEALAKAPPAMAILESAEILGADLVVVGTSGHNFWHRMVLGSTATRVVSEAACPVLVVPHASGA